MGLLDGKIAVVTGASSGIGKQIAIRMSEEGANVAICARREKELGETAELCRQAGAEVLAVVLDISELEKLPGFIDKAVERFGTVDVLVNNATVAGLTRPFVEFPLETFKQYMAVDCYAVIELMRAAYPHMKGKEFASIINVSSGVVIGAPQLAPYAASKGAQDAITRVAASEWGKDGIRVNTIYPVAATEGVYASEPEFRDYMLKTFSDNRLGYPGDAYRDVAPVAVFLASEMSRNLTGQSLHVEGGGKVW